MKAIHSVYDQIAELIARLEPKKVLALKASNEVQQRFDFLINKSREVDINRQEKDELDHFIVIEKLFRLAKIKADISLQNK